MSVGGGYVHVRTGTSQNPEEDSDPLELELQAVVN